MQTILVTGGSGYIGTVVCSMLMDAGYKVINVDRHSHKMEGVTTFNYDIGDSTQMRGLLKLAKPDAIVHLAASGSAPKSVIDPAETYQNNVANTLDLLHAAIEFGIDKFVFSSSSSVYGNVDNATKEDQPTNPQSPYGKSKLIIENMLEDFDKAYGFKYVAFRYFNAAGTYKTRGYKKDPKEHVLPILAEAAINDEEFTIFGADYDTKDGTCERDYTHVSDIARAHVNALEYLFTGGNSEIINLGSGFPTSIIKLITTIEDELDAGELKIIEGPRREGDPSKTHADITKAATILDWEPRYTIYDIIPEELQWAKQHKK